MSKIDAFAVPFIEIRKGANRFLDQPEFHAQTDQEKTRHPAELIAETPLQGVEASRCWMARLVGVLFGCGLRERRPSFFGASYKSGAEG